MLVFGGVLILSTVKTDLKVSIGFETILRAGFYHKLGVFLLGR